MALAPGQLLGDPLLGDCWLVVEQMGKNPAKKAKTTY